MLLLGPQAFLHVGAERVDRVELLVDLLRELVVEGRELLLLDDPDIEFVGHLLAGEVLGLVVVGIGDLNPAALSGHGAGECELELLHELPRAELHGELGDLLLLVGLVVEPDGGVVHDDDIASRRRPLDVDVLGVPLADVGEDVVDLLRGHLDRLGRHVEPAIVVDRDLGDRLHLDGEAQRLVLLRLDVAEDRLAEGMDLPRREHVIVGEGQNRLEGLGVDRLGVAPVDDRLRRLPLPEPGNGGLLRDRSGHPLLLFQETLPVDLDGDDLPARRLRCDIDGYVVFRQLLLHVFLALWWMVFPRTGDILPVGPCRPARPEPPPRIAVAVPGVRIAPPGKEYPQYGEHVTTSSPGAPARPVPGPIRRMHPTN